jgi:hypothetical protein
MRIKVRDGKSALDVYLSISQDLSAIDYQFMCIKKLFEKFKKIIFIEKIPRSLKIAYRTFQFFGLKNIGAIQCYIPLSLFG